MSSEINEFATADLNLEEIQQSEMGMFPGFSMEELAQLNVEGRSSGADMGSVPGMISSVLDQIQSRLFKKFTDGNFKARIIEVLEQKKRSYELVKIDKEGALQKEKFRLKNLEDQKAEIEKKMMENKPVEYPAKFYITTGLLVALVIFIWAFYFQNLKPVGLMNGNPLVPLLFPLVFFLIGYFMEELFSKGKKTGAVSLALVALVIDFFISKSSHGVTCSEINTNHWKCAFQDEIFYLILIVGFLSYLAFGYFLSSVLNMLEQNKPSVILEQLGLDKQRKELEILDSMQATATLESEISKLNVLIQKVIERIQFYQAGNYSISGTQLNAGFQAYAQGFVEGKAFLYRNDTKKVQEFQNQVEELLKNKISDNSSSSYLSDNQ